MFAKTMFLLATIFFGGQSTPDASVKVKVKPVPRLNADEVVQKMQHFYKRTDKMTAKFRQTYTNKVMERKTVSDGKMWLKKPGKMRLDYRGKRKRIKKSVISDGTTLYVLEHDLKQIHKMNLKNEVFPVAVRFLLGRGDLRKEFKASISKSRKYGARKDYVINLVPHIPNAQYKRLILVVDPKNFRVKQSIILEASGNTNHFRFYSPSLTRRVKSSWFLVNEKKYKHYQVRKANQKKG